MEASNFSQLVDDTGTPFNTLADNFVAFMIGLIGLVLLAWLSGPISRLVIKPMHYVSKSQLLAVVVRRAIAILVILLGVYIFLRMAGLSQFAVAVLSGTGLAGLVVGFAFKDIAENFISSLLLSIQKPFQIGDLLSIDTYTGIVSKVTSRATTLVDFDGNYIQIPNATVYKNIVKNYTANPKTRIQFELGVGYDVPVNDVQEMILDKIKSHSAVLDQPAPQVLVDKLGASSIHLTVFCWIDSTKTSLLKAKSTLQKRVLALLLAEGVSMPDDARERILIRQPNIQQTHQTNHRAVIDDSSESDETASEVDEITRQVQNSRSPEGGENIL